jgi:hypothetical protein
VPFSADAPLAGKDRRQIANNDFLAIFTAPLGGIP